MKKILASFALLAVAASSYAAPLVTVGDQLDLFFKGAVMGKWDSNVLLSNSNKKDDYSVTVRLGVEADYGRNSKFKANIKFYEDINRYLNYSSLDSNLANVFATASYTENVWTLSTNFSFQQVKQNTSTIYAPTLVRRDIYNAGFNFAYDFSDKLFGEIGGTWYAERFCDYERTYSDSDVYSLPVSLLYKVTPKISVGLTYQLRYSDFNNGDAYAASFGSDRWDNFGGVTIRGEIFEKLSTVIYAGVMNRQMNDAQNSDFTDFAFSAKFDYRVTEKLTAFVKGYRDFGNGAQRQSSVNTGCDFGVSYAMTETLSAVASFGYVNTKYKLIDRDDDEVYPRVGITYNPNKYISLSANYRYLNNSSNVYAYNQHVIDLAFNVRY